MGNGAGMIRLLLKILLLTIVTELHWYKAIPPPHWALLLLMVQPSIRALVTYSRPMPPPAEVPSFVPVWLPVKVQPRKTGEPPLQNAPAPHCGQSKLPLFSERQ